jgi:hypothetical protein
MFSCSLKDVGDVNPVGWIWCLHGNDCEEQHVFLASWRTLWYKYVDNLPKWEHTSARVRNVSSHRIKLSKFSSLKSRYFCYSKSLGLWNIWIFRNCKYLKKKKKQHLGGKHLSIGSLRTPTPEDGNRPSFRNYVFSSYLEFRTTDKIHKPSDSYCYSPSSKPFNF